MDKLDEHEANSSRPGADPAAARVFSVREDGYCFACGSENPIGLKLEFRLFGEQVQGVFTPAAEHQGFVGIIHGGLVTLVLDEAMAKLLALQGIEALTCELTIRLHTTARIGEPLHVTAWCVRARRRLLELKAQAVLASGECVATAQAKFLRVGERRGDTKMKERTHADL